MIERIRRNSIKTPSPQQLASSVIADLNNNNSSISNKEDNEERNKITNQYTFSPTNSERRPSIFQTETIRKMHSAVELNKKISEKSKNASLVLLNIPQPPKYQGDGDYNCKLFDYI